MAGNEVVTILLVLNLGFLGYIIKENSLHKGGHKSGSRIPTGGNNPHYLHQSGAAYEKPYVIFSKHGVDVTFKNPNTPLNPDDEALTYRFRREKIKECLPYLREYDEPTKVQNEGLMEEMPNYIPIFKEKANMVDLKHSIKEYRKRIANDWSTYSLIHKLGYYKHFNISKEKYNDAPDQGPDFALPNMGMFNNPHYCQFHDTMVLAHPEIVMEKLYFFSDYHPLSIPRYFALGKFGKDTLPKVSKNMKKLNWYQRLYAFDPRTSIFYTKKAAFHTWHKIGKHFACWGQSFNHIPGHGMFIRKDLLVTSANDYLKRWLSKFLIF